MAGGETLEAKIAKDADYLDQMFLLKEYACQGSKEAERWLGKSEKYTPQKKLQTDLAKKIAEELKKQGPSDWWDNVFSADKR